MRIHWNEQEDFSCGHGKDMAVRQVVLQVGLYVDPPYLLETRTSKHYKHEFTTRQKHLALLEVCMKHKGPCLISSYDNELYNTVLRDWKKRTIKVQTNNAKTAIECLYLNRMADMEMRLF